MDKNILVFAQDPGGAKNIAILARRLLTDNKLKLIIFIHPLAKDAFDAFDVPYEIISSADSSLLFDENVAESFLNNGKYSHVLCTVSTTAKDLTNARLIETARKLSLPTFGILDHWKGLNRFFDESGKPIYMPDVLGCIDDFTVQRLVKMGINKNRLLAVGHVYLEQVYLYGLKEQKRAKETKDILLVSQPLVFNKSYQSIFSVDFFPGTLMANLCKVFDKLKENLSLNIYYRAHPKEEPFRGIPQYVAIDKSANWYDILKDYDIFIGLDSMLLIEACVFGKRSISLVFPEIKDVAMSSYPFRFSLESKDITSFEKHLLSALENNAKYFPSVEENVQWLKGSLDKSTKAFYDFLEKRNFD